MANELRTRSGLRPDERNLPYTITTQFVREFLQGKFDVIVDKMNEANTRGKKQEKIDIKLFTTGAGGAFFPFIIMLPLAVLERYGLDESNDEPSIFHPEEDEDLDAVLLKDEFYQLIKIYAFSKEDESAFFSDDWRRQRKVSRETSRNLKVLRTPKVNRYDCGGEKVPFVVMLLDPIRVFHDILTSPDNPCDFTVEINSWQKLQKDGEFSYSVTRRMLKKGNKKYSNQYVDELNKMLRQHR